MTRSCTVSITYGPSSLDIFCFFRFSVWSVLPNALHKYRKFSTKIEKLSELINNLRNQMFVEFLSRTGLDVLLRCITWRSLISPCNYRGKFIPWLRPHKNNYDKNNYAQYFISTYTYVNVNIKLFQDKLQLFFLN
jgi:hypothetical protein